MAVDTCFFTPVVCAFSVVYFVLTQLTARKFRNGRSAPVPKDQFIIKISYHLKAVNRLVG